MQLEAGSGGGGAVSPFLEMGAYEALWLRPGTTFLSPPALFAGRPRPGGDRNPAVARVSAREHRAAAATGGGFPGDQPGAAAALRGAELAARPRLFPARNVTLAALAAATVVVDASGEQSGTLIQARVALRQGRRLFVLDSCFRDGAGGAAGGAGGGAGADV